MIRTNENGSSAANTEPVKRLSKRAADFIALFTTWSIFDFWIAAWLCIVATVAVRGCGL